MLLAASVCTPFNVELMAMNNCVGLAYDQHSGIPLIEDIL